MTGQFFRREAARGIRAAVNPQRLDAGHPCLLGPGSLAPLCCALSLVASAGSARAQLPDQGPAQKQEPGENSGKDPVRAPEVIHRVEAVYPPEALADGLQGSVALLVTVEADGSVGDVRVQDSAGAVLDQAAVAAVRQWRFRPAVRGDRAVQSRIRVLLRFALPASPESPAAGSEPAAQPAPLPRSDEREPAALPAPGQAPIDVTVRGERELRSQDRSASDFTVRGEVLRAAPRQEGAEALRAAPGLYIARAEGPAVAHRYMLRGFDADHGQDLELRVGGIPINLPSHIHGQGYADLGFLAAEVVRELHATEGVYDPRQGDFAVAGSIEVHLGVAERGWQIKSGYGAFRTFRQLLLWAPPQQAAETFGAVQYTSTDGFGENRQGQAASAIVQTGLGQGRWRYRVLAAAYGAGASLAGVVRADDIDRGVVDYHGVYPYATARGQRAGASRVLGGGFAEYRGAGGDNAEVGAWLSRDAFRLQENFTGFIQRSRTLDQVAGRGDLIEQQNRTSSVGIAGRYRTAAYQPAGLGRGTVELGMAARRDSIDQEQALLDAAVRNQTWDRRVDATIEGTDIGFWGDVDWRVAPLLRFRVGLRADVLAYDIDDRLGNYVPISRPDDTYLVGFRRSAWGVASGPRASAEVTPLPWLAVRAAYGEGYRSPQARTLEDGERAPFSKVRSADLGVRLAASDRLRLSAAGFATQLSDDVAFDAEEGRLERIGKTRRLGAVAHGEGRWRDWLIGALSITYVDAELREAPPVSAEEPLPPFQPGQNVPFVPPVVVRLDLGARPTLAGDRVRGHGGAGFSFLSPRPLPHGEFAEPVALLDASLGLAWGPVAVAVSVYNLLDNRYAAIEYNFASHWNPDEPRPRTPARHIAAGAPRSWMATVELAL